MSCSKQTADRVIATRQVETQQVKSTILSHSEFVAYQQRVISIFETWRETHAPRLGDMDTNVVPKTIIHALSEDLLVQFGNLPLLDRYDVYQKLMDYWDEVMQDDVYLITADGWVAASQPRELIQDKKVKETPDLTIKKKKYKMDLISPALIVARYFADEQAQIENLQTALETATQTLEEYIEEHTGEDGLLADATNDSRNITKANVKARLDAIQPDLMTLREAQDNDNEPDALEHCLSLIDTKAKADKAVKDAQLALDEQVLARYATLTEPEIKQLVIDDKWFATIQAAVVGEVQRLTQELTDRVKELEERYAQPLLVLEEEVEGYSVRVEEHFREIWEWTLI